MKIQNSSLCKGPADAVHLTCRRCSKDIYSTPLSVIKMTFSYYIPAHVRRLKKRLLREAWVVSVSSGILGIKQLLIASYEIYGEDEKLWCNKITTEISTHGQSSYRSNRWAIVFFYNEPSYLKPCLCKHHHNVVTSSTSFYSLYHVFITL